MIVRKIEEGVRGWVVKNNYKNMGSPAAITRKRGDGYSPQRVFKNLKQVIEHAQANPFY